MISAPTPIERWPMPAGPQLALPRSELSGRGAAGRGGPALRPVRERVRVRVRSMGPADIPRVIDLQRRVYPSIEPWSADKLDDQLSNFPQGQVVAEGSDGLLGYAGSLIVLWDEWADAHSWTEITSNGTFNHHNPRGRTLYGAEVFVSPEARGLGVGHRLYDARRTLCRAMNLKRIIACGRLPGYGAVADRLDAQAYAQRVVWGDHTDPVLSFQLREGFSYCGVVPQYLPDDHESRGFASIIVWLNPEYDAASPTHVPKRVRL